MNTTIHVLMREAAVEEPLFHGIYPIHWIHYHGWLTAQSLEYLVMSESNVCYAGNILGFVLFAHNRHV